MTLKATNLLLSASFCCSVSFAQPTTPLQRLAGGAADDNLAGVALTKDGGLLTGGTSYSGASRQKTEASRGGSDYWVVKYTKTGAIQWNKTVGSGKDDNLAGVLQTADGGYVLGGSSRGGVSGDKTSPNVGGSAGNYWLIKLDGNGDVLWDKTIGDNYDDYYGYYEFSLRSLQPTIDKGFILAGIFYNDQDGYYNPYYVAKLDSNGTTQWTNTYASIASSAVIKQTPDGGYILAGTNANNAFDEKDYQAIRIDKDGNSVWNQTYRAKSSSKSYLSSLLITGNGYLLGGYTNSGKGNVKTQPNYGSGNDFWLLSLDANGNVLRDKTIGGGNDDVLTSLESAADGGFLLGGYSASDTSGDKTENSRGGYDYWMVKLNANGSKFWDKTYGGSGDDLLKAAKERKPDEFVLAGSSNSAASGDKTLPPAGGYDYWLLGAKYNPVAPVTAKPSAPDFTVYPNPAVGAINIFAKSKAQFGLSNQSGRVIATKTIIGKGSFDASRLQPGSYFITNLATGARQTVLVVR